MNTVVKIFIVLFLLSGIRLLPAADIMIPASNIQESSKGVYYLVSIGVNNYRDSFWPTLKWPASDATRIADTIGNETPLRTEKQLLINEFATRDNVMKALNNIADSATEKDTVVLYVSGHGTLKQTSEGELERVVVLHDTGQSQLLSSGLLHSELNQWLGRLSARKKMMIFATCHSGEGKSRLPEAVQGLLRSNKGKLQPLSEASEGALVLAAAAKGEAARENDELKGDIYTHYLLEALTLYDRNRDGMVSALEAHDYARDRTWAFSKGRQRPTANIKQIGDADIPLYGKKVYAGLPILEAYDESLSGFQIRVDDGIKGVLPFAFPMKAGGSIVSLYSPGGSKPLSRYKVKAGSGQSITLGNVMNDRPLNISSHIRRFSWSDKGWEKLTGSADTMVAEFNAGYQLGGFGVGLTFNLPAEEDNIIRAPIKSTAKLTGAFLTMDYSIKRRTRIFTARLGYGHERMAITLDDTSTGDRLSFSDTSRSLAMSAMVGFRLASDMFLLVDAGVRKADWEFTSNADTSGNQLSLGDLSGDRRWLSVGINYRIGWSARTLWR